MLKSPLKKRVWMKKLALCWEKNKKVPRLKKKGIHVLQKYKHQIKFAVFFPSIFSFTFHSLFHPFPILQHPSIPFMYICILFSTLIHWLVNLSLIYSLSLTCSILPLPLHLLLNFPVNHPPTYTHNHIQFVTFGIISKQNHNKWKNSTEMRNFLIY